MRNEQEMFNLILDVARKDNRILAAYMNGSRTNPNAVKDIFQDYDIVYVVKETKSFREDKTWIDRFGKRLYMQYPEESIYYPSDIENNYGWLLQFDDGNRLDLHVETITYMKSHIYNDTLCVILLDKDNVLPLIPEATDKAYWVKKPTEQEFQCTCNEFWWCLNNVAKGLWRKEIPYVMDMLNFNVRTMLIRLLAWKAGVENHFTVSVGKSGKYLYRWLPKNIWDKFLKTYPSGEIKEIWNSVFLMCEFFNEIAENLSVKFNYMYNKEEAYNSLQFLKDIENLPEDAEKIY